ncbi:MAG: hypothetical protein FWG68_10460 [Defluviitaleaceae bacterium]|nr:hypothetical protein [Defluviitaleaceae bacterium]
MTEEEKLNRAPGCGSFIMAGLIIIVILALVGIIFPYEILPYPTEILAVVAVVAAIALIIYILMLRSRAKDRKKAADDKADELLRRGFQTLGDADDEASRLAEKYYTEDTSSENKKGAD